MKNVFSHLLPSAGRSRLAELGVGLAAVAMLAACGSTQKPQQQTRRNEAVPVLVAPVEQKDIPVQIKAIGSVEPYSTVQVKSMINGELTGVAFTEGQDVKKGQLLFTLDKRPFEAALQQAQAALARDQAQAANQNAQAKRYDDLFKQGIISKEQRDAQVSSSEALNATVAADRAAVDNSKVQLSYCDIYSPIDGRTGNLIVHQGNQVKAQDTTGLVVINKITPIFVTFSVPEQYLSDIKKYKEQRSLLVNASIPNDPKPATGRLSFIDNAVDTTTGTIKLKGEFANNDRRLWPGQFSDVELTLTTQPHAIVVPSQAVQTGQNGQYVFVVKSDNTAEMRPVKVTRTVGDQTVIASGVNPGEQVVTDGQLRLAPTGTKVEAKRAPGPTGSAPSSQNAGGGPVATSGS